MYCSYCGVALGADHSFCASCGKQAAAAVAPRGVASGPVANMARHLQLLGFLWIAVSVLNLIGAAVLFVLSRTALIAIDLPFLGPHFLHGLFGMLSWLMMLKALAGFAAGFGLLERHTWARPLALVLGVVSLIKVPIGTALGIYTLWVLMPARAEEEYRRLALAA